MNVFLTEYYIKNVTCGDKFRVSLPKFWTDNQYLNLSEQLYNRVDQYPQWAMTQYLNTLFLSQNKNFQV